MVKTNTIERNSMTHLKWVISIVLYFQPSKIEAVDIFKVSIWIFFPVEFFHKIIYFSLFPKSSLFPNIAPSSSSFSGGLFLDVGFWKNGKKMKLFDNLKILKIFEDWLKRLRRLHFKKTYWRFQKEPRTNPIYEPPLK